MCGSERLPRLPETHEGLGRGNKDGGLDRGGAARYVARNLGVVCYWGRLPHYAGHDPKSQPNDARGDNPWQPKKTWIDL